MKPYFAGSVLVPTVFPALSPLTVTLKSPIQLMNKETEQNLSRCYWQESAGQRGLMRVAGSTETGAFIRLTGALHHPPVARKL